MEEEKCPKCHGTGIRRNPDGSVSTCFDCLQNGKLDTHTTDIKETKIRL